MTARTTKRRCLLRYTRCSGEEVGIYLRGRVLSVEIDGERDRCPITLPKWRDPDAAALAWADEDARLCPGHGDGCDGNTYGWARANATGGRDAE